MRSWTWSSLLMPGCKENGVQFRSQWKGRQPKLCEIGECVAKAATCAGFTITVPLAVKWLPGSGAAWITSYNIREGLQVHGSAWPQDGEVVLCKPGAADLQSSGHHLSMVSGKGAFFLTGLNQLLRDRGISHLIFCGVTTEAGGNLKTPAPSQSCLC